MKEIWDKILNVGLWILIIIAVISFPIGIICAIIGVAMDIPKMDAKAWALIIEVVVFVIWYIGWRNK